MLANRPVASLNKLMQPLRNQAIVKRYASNQQQFLNSFPKIKTNTFFNICRQNHSAVITRFGKFYRICEPGWFFSIPFIDRIYHVDKRELTIQINPQMATTNDNVSVEIGGSIFLQVVDPMKACFGASLPLYLAEQQAQAVMRSGIGTVALDSLFHNRNNLNQILCQEMQNSAKEWGLKIQRYELTTIRPDHSVSVAMDKQAVAERTRREQILSAEATKSSTVLVSEGNRIQQVNEAEGNKTKVILEAEAKHEEVVINARAQAEATMVVAQAQAEAIEMIAKVLETKQGILAMNTANAREYMKMMSAVLANGSHHTLFIPSDISSVDGMVAKGMAIAGQISKNQSN